MKRQLICWNKRLLAWALTLAMVAGMFTTLPQTEAQAAETQSPVLLNEQQATEATRILYGEDFESYENATLDTGENEEYNLYVPSDSTTRIEDGQLYFETTGGNPLYVLDGEMWGYYTMEADITYKMSTTGAKVCFYVQNADKYVTATLPEGESGDVFYVQIVANGTTAKMSYATYGLLGVKGEMSEPETVDVAVTQQSGSIGFNIVPNDGETTAAMTIDNIEVTRNVDQEEAKHTLLSVSFNEYTQSKNMGATNTYDDYYIKTSATGISVIANEQKLNITSDNNGYGVMYFDVADAVHWDNYVVEADVCQTNSTGWGSLLYRVQSLESFQSGGLHADGTADLKGYWHDWVNDGIDNGIYHEKDTEATVNENDIRRLKIVVHGDMADLYAASYTDNDNTKALEEWQYLMSINDIADHHETGSVGFLVAEGAAYWMDNLDVYEYTTTYVEDFDTYSDRTLYDGATYTVVDGTLPEDASELAKSQTFVTKDTETGLTMQLYNTDSANSTVAIRTVEGEDKALIIDRETNDNIHATLAWLEAGKNWTNYTYEVDILPTTVSAAYWHGLAYRVDSRELWQRAAIATQGGNVLNRVGSGAIGVDTANGVDSYLDKFTAPYDYNELLSSNIGFASGAEIRMKVVVKNYCTWIYTARYNNGILEPYNLHVVLDYCESLTGAAGMVVSHEYEVAYDNIVVSATTQETGVTNLADIVEPDTGIVNPATIVTKVDESNYGSLTGTAVAILDIDTNLDILGTDKLPIGSVSQFMHKYGDTIIPAFYLDDSSDVTAICDYLKKHVITDALYVTSDATLLLSARQKWGFARGVLEYTEMPTDHAATRREINGNLAMVTILPNETLTQELVAEYNVRGVSVWSYAEDTADVYKGIANGYNGLIASNPKTILDVYESIQDPTLSGKPIVIGHQGMFVEGEYYGNTIESYTTAINEYGAMAVEIDAKITADKKFVMMHDLTLDRTTNGTGTISQMNLDDIQSYQTKCGQEIPTLEQAMQALSETDAVVYIDHAEANAAYIAEYNRLIEEYNMQDQVVVMCGRTQVNDVGSYVWTNSSWGEDVPVISGSLWLERDYDVTTATVDEILSTSIHRLSRYNHQQIPFEHSVLGQDDTTAYNVGARGFLYLQATTPDVTVGRDEAEETQSAAKLAIDRAYISEKGATAVIIDDPERTQDYAHKIQVEDDIVKIGETLNLNKTIKKVVGADTEVACKVTWLTDNVVEKDGSYTMNEPGVATAVYYKNIELDRGYDTLTYRIYSEPVTITWNEEGKPHEHSYGDWEMDEDYHWHECACGAIQDKVAHIEAADKVGVVEATESADGYSGDKICEICKYVMEEGEVLKYDRFPGFTYLTPKSFGFEYDKQYYNNGSYIEAPTIPACTMDKTIYTTRFSFGNCTMVYMRDAKNIYNGLQMTANGFSTTADSGYWTMTNYLPESSTNDVIYMLDKSTGEYKSATAWTIRAYDFTDTSKEFEFAITTEFCDFDGDGEGTNDDIKVALWFDGNIYTDKYRETSYFYLKDCADICNPGLRITPKTEDVVLKEATIITEPHVHTYVQKCNADRHWKICECGRVVEKGLHTETVKNDKKATATEKGYTGDKICSACEYVIEEGTELVYRELSEYTVLTPESFGFEYDKQYYNSGSYTEAPAIPACTMDKTIYTTRFSFGNCTMVYMRDAKNIYNGLQMTATGFSTTADSGYWTMTNYLPESSTNDVIYMLDKSTGEYKSASSWTIRAYDFTDTSKEFEFAITTEFCDFDGDGEGTNDDIKVALWFDGNIYTDKYRETSYFYLKDCADICNPGLRITPKTEDVVLKEVSLASTSIQPTITDSIALNYTATINSMISKTADPIMTFEKAGKTYGPVIGKAVADGSDTYTFTYPNIMAQAMDKNIKATLTVGNCSKTYEYSVLDYCEYVLGADALYDAEGTAYSTAKQAAAKDLVVDLVQYGAAVQTYRGVAAENLHTAKIANWESYVTQYDNADKEDTNLEGLSDSYISDKLIQESGVQESDAYAWKSATLVLDNKVQLRCKFSATDIWNLTVKLQVGDGEEMPIEYQKTDVLGVYVFDFEDIYAYEYGKQITVRFYEGNQQVGKTLNYSVNTYLYAKKNVTNVPNLQPLLLAIHNYGKAADVYHQAQ